MPTLTVDDMREKEYEMRIEVDRLRREVYSQPLPSVPSNLMDELLDAEEKLDEIENQLSMVPEGEMENGLILDSVLIDDEARGLATTGIEAKVYLRMAHVPTAYYHLLNRTEDPLISCKVHVNEDDDVRRMRVTSYIEGYSARAVDTFEVEPGDSHSFVQLPTLFPDRIRDLNELTRGSLNIMVQDLDGAVELHQTYPIWMLARTTAPLAVWDPKKQKWLDMSKYFGAFVTPNSGSLMTFLRIAADHHPSGRLVGYQGNQEGVTQQVKALFEALKQEADITYVNSLIDFNPAQGFASQRVRLPRESLADKEANCIDGTVLFASLLEGISLNPAIILVPGHAFVAWESWRGSGEWKYLETTMIGNSTFEAACTSAENTAKKYKQQGKLRMWPLSELRTKYGITPME